MKLINFWLTFKTNKALQLAAFLTSTSGECCFPALGEEYFAQFCTQIGNIYWSAFIEHHLSEGVLKTHGPDSTWIIQDP